MSGPASRLSGASVPALARGVKLREDKARGGWVLNAPERIIMLDEIAHEILSHCGEGRTVADISRALAAKYDAPAATIETDVLELLQDLADKGYISA